MTEVRPTVLLLDTVHPSLSSLLEQQGWKIEPAYELSTDEVLQRFPGAKGLVIRSRFSLKREFLSQAIGLDFVARVGAGMENIDVEAAAELGIRCLHAPEGNQDAVAEHTMGMLLGLLNHLPRADREVRQGIWQREANRGTELHGKTIGIIGYGNMGSAFAQRLAGFGVRVLVHDTALKTEFPPHDYRTSASLAHIQKEADVVSLHINYTQENYHYVNSNWLKAFEKPIYLINTARGKVLDTRALLTSIQEGKVLGAGLDVLEFESLSFETLDASAAQVLKQLMEEERVLLTPHIAGWSHESNEKMAVVLANKIGTVKYSLGKG